MPSVKVWGEQKGRTEMQKGRTEMVSKQLLATVVSAAMLFTVSAAIAQTRTNDTQKNTTTTTKDQNKGQNTGQRPGASGFAPGHTGKSPPGHGGPIPGQEMKKDGDSKNSPRR